MTVDHFRPVANLTTLGGGGTPSDWARQPFDAALARYGSRLMQVGMALAERQQQLLRTYLGATGQSGYFGAQDANAAEYQELIGAVQSLNSDRIASAQSAFLESVGKLQEAVFANAKTALDDLVSGMQEAWAESQAQCHAAYGEYVRDVATAFNSLTGDALDPATLMSVGQALTIAAAYASMAMQKPAFLSSEAAGGTTLR
jgi:hypothetical protein